MEEPAPSGRTGGLRAQWAGITFEKKLSLFVAPVFVAVVAAVIISQLPSTRDDGTHTTVDSTEATINGSEYRNRIRSICERDAALERDDRTKADRALEGFRSSGQIEVFFQQIATMLLDSINSSKELAADLESLHPPTEKEERDQAEAVSAWGRQIAAEQSFVDDLRRGFASGIPNVSPVLGGDLVGTARAFEDQKDTLLRKLAETGCNPTP